MALEFVGIDPNTGQNGSPTAWVDPKTRDIVLQSYTADEVTRQECIENTAPGHAKGIPDHESVIRVPAHLIPLLREACECDTKSLQLSG